MTTPRVAAVVLAGGRSSRFGRDKLREPIDGVPLLARAVQAVAAVATEVTVVGGVTGDPSLPAGVRLVRDERPFEGPLAALGVGLRATDAELVLVVGGDMPSMVPAVLERLIATAGAPGVDGAVLGSEGRHRPLPLVVRRTVAEPVVRNLVASGERRLRAAVDALSVVVIPEAAWLADDPSGATLRDVDTPDDM